MQVKMVTATIYYWATFWHVENNFAHVILGATEEGELGTHILQYFWSSTFYNFSHPLAYFITTTAPAEDLIAFFWQGVSLLQESGLEILAAIFDGSAGNRRFQVGYQLFLSLIEKKRSTRYTLILALL